MEARHHADASPSRYPPSLLLFACFYGGMVTLGGILGAKQIAIGPLAVEGGIFPFLTLVALSSAVAQLHGQPMANRLTHFGFAPLIGAILLALFVLALPADPGMAPPARTAFPIVLSQSWRMMAAGIIAYGISVRLNIGIFSRLGQGHNGRSGGRYAPLRGAMAAAVSQIVDTLIFITIAFLGVRPILTLMVGQIVTKLLLSTTMVPLLIAMAVRVGRWLDRDVV